MRQDRKLGIRQAQHRHVAWSIAGFVRPGPPRKHASSGCVFSAALGLASWGASRGCRCGALLPWHRHSEGGRRRWQRAGRSAPCCGAPCCGCRAAASPAVWLAGVTRPRMPAASGSRSPALCATGRQGSCLRRSGSGRPGRRSRPTTGR